MSLPTPRTFMTNLLNSFPSAAASSSSTSTSYKGKPPTASNALKDAPANLKSLLVTLHVLFPNELLPALDVLDRRLVVRVRVARDGEHDQDMTSRNVAEVQGNEQPALLPDEERAVSPSPTGEEDSNHALYFVHSAQSQNQYQSRYHQGLPAATSCYEVRTSTWNCSCPAFTFSAFPMAATNFDKGHGTYDESSTGGPRSTTTGLDYPLPDPLSLDDSVITFRWGGFSRSRGAVPVCKHLLACVLLERCEIVFGDCVEEKVLSSEELAGSCAGWGG